MYFCYFWFVFLILGSSTAQILKSYVKKYPNLRFRTIKYDATLGGLLIGGFVSPETEQEPFVAKIGLDGEMEWSKMGVIEGDDEVYNLLYSFEDYGFFAVGSTQLVNPEPDGLILKFDVNGEVEWGKVVTDHVHNIRKMIRTSDNGYVIIGDLISGNLHDDLFVIKFDENWNVVFKLDWGKDINYHGDPWNYFGDERAYDVIESPDGGIIVVGETASYSLVLQYYKAKACAVKFTSTGSFSWLTVFPDRTGTTPKTDHGRSVSLTPDGEYIYAASFGYGYTHGHRDITVVKIRVSDGQGSWGVYLGGIAEEKDPVVISVEDGCIVAYSSFSFFPKRAIGVTKISESGNCVWSRIIGFPWHVNFRGFEMTEMDSMYILADDSAGHSYIIKLDENGNENGYSNSTFDLGCSNSGNFFRYKSLSPRTLSSSHYDVEDFEPTFFDAELPDIYVVEEVNLNLEYPIVFTEFPPIDSLEFIEPLPLSQFKKHFSSHYFGEIGKTMIVFGEKDDTASLRFSVYERHGEIMNLFYISSMECDVFPGTEGSTIVDFLIFIGEDLYGDIEYSLLLCLSDESLISYHLVIFKAVDDDGLYFSIGGNEQVYNSTTSSGKKVLDILRYENILLSITEDENGRRIDFGIPLSSMYYFIYLDDVISFSSPSNPSESIVSVFVGTEEKWEIYELKINVETFSSEVIEYSLTGVFNSSDIFPTNWTIDGIVEYDGIIYGGISKCSLNSSCIFSINKTNGIADILKIVEGYPHIGTIQIITPGSILFSAFSVNPEVKVYVFKSYNIKNEEFSGDHLVYEELPFNSYLPFAFDLSVSHEFDEIDIGKSFLTGESLSLEMTWNSYEPYVTGFKHQSFRLGRCKLGFEPNFDEGPGLLLCEPCQNENTTTRYLDTYGNSSCYPCPVGFYLENYECEMCGFQYYNELEGSTACEICPNNRSTQTQIAHNISQCDVCLDGYFTPSLDETNVNVGCISCKNYFDSYPETRDDQFMMDQCFYTPKNHSLSFFENSEEKFLFHQNNNNQLYKNLREWVHVYGDGRLVLSTVERIYVEHDFSFFFTPAITIRFRKYSYVMEGVTGAEPTNELYFSIPKNEYEFHRISVDEENHLIFLFYKNSDHNDDEYYEIEIFYESTDENEFYSFECNSVESDVSNPLVNIYAANSTLFIISENGQLSKFSTNDCGTGYLDPSLILIDDLPTLCNAVGHKFRSMKYWNGTEFIVGTDQGRMYKIDPISNTTVCQFLNVDIGSSFRIEEIYVNLEMSRVFGGFSEAGSPDGTSKLVLVDMNGITSSELSSSPTFNTFGTMIQDGQNTLFWFSHRNRNTNRGYRVEKVIEYRPERFLKQVSEISSDHRGIIGNLEYETYLTNNGEMYEKNIGAVMISGGSNDFYQDFDIHPSKLLGCAGNGYVPFEDIDGNWYCLQLCEVPTTTVELEHTYCVSCDVGYNVDQQLVIPYTTDLSLVDRCDHCPLGYYYSSGDCMACPAGTYSDEEFIFQIEDCKDCPNGYWSYEASSYCNECGSPVRFYYSVIPRNEDSCIECPVYDPRDRLYYGGDLIDSCFNCLENEEEDLFCESFEPIQVFEKNSMISFENEARLYDQRKRVAKISEDLIFFIVVDEDESFKFGVISFDENEDSYNVGEIDRQRHDEFGMNTDECMVDVDLENMIIFVLCYDGIELVIYQYQLNDEELNLISSTLHVVSNHVYSVAVSEQKLYATIHQTVYEIEFDQIRTPSISSIGNCGASFRDIKFVNNRTIIGVRNHAHLLDIIDGTCELISVFDVNYLDVVEMTEDERYALTGGNYMSITGSAKVYSLDLQNKESKLVGKDSEFSYVSSIYSKKKDNFVFSTYEYEWGYQRLGSKYTHLFNMDNGESYEADFRYFSQTFDEDNPTQIYYTAILWIPRKEEIVNNGRIVRDEGFVVVLKQSDRIVGGDNNNCEEISTQRYVIESCNVGYFPIETSSGWKCFKSCYPPYTTYGYDEMVCQECPPGQFLDDEYIGYHKCFDCSPGYYSVGGQNECTPCPSGAYCDGVALFDYTYCPAGYYQPLTGQDSIQDCIVCGQGRWSNVSGIDSADECTKCSPGYYSSSEVATSQNDCIACPKGSFSTEFGSSSCEECGLGYITLSEGSTNISDCTKCPAGTFGNETCGSRCFLCPSGTYGTVLGLTDVADCTKCPQGTYNLKKGSNSSVDCLPCGKGKYNDILGSSLESECRKCPEGSWSSEEILSSDDDCIPCGKGYYTIDDGCTNYTECVKCPPGQWQPYEIGDSFSCRLCPPGKYSDVFGASECKSCGLGRFNPSVGATDRESFCQLCPRGKFNNQSMNAANVDACRPCPPDTKNPNMGSMNHTDCVACEETEECGKGFSTPLPRDLCLNSIEFDNTFQDNVGGGASFFDTSFYLKISFILFIILVGILLISILFCTLPVCKMKCLEKIDVFFSLNHDVNEGESKVKKKTFYGGVLSLIVLIIATMLICWSLIDFFYGNTVVYKSVSPKFGENRIYDVESVFIIDFTVYGVFEYSSATFSSTGFQKPGQLTCDSPGAISVDCRWICKDCYFNEKIAQLVATFDSTGNYINLVEFTIGLPHYEDRKSEEIDDAFQIKGSFFESRESLKSVIVDVDCYATNYLQYSSFSILLQLFGLDTRIERDGMFGALMSNEVTKSNETSNLVFTTNLLLSSLKYRLKEEYSQTLLGLVAQVFALFSLSLTLTGFFLFPLFECICFRRFYSHNKKVVFDKSLIEDDGKKDNATTIVVVSDESDESNSDESEGQNKDDKDDDDRVMSIELKDQNPKSQRVDENEKYLMGDSFILEEIKDN